MSQSTPRVSPDQPQADPHRRRFPEPLKRDAVRLVTHERYSFKAAAQAVGVSDNSLRQWFKKYAQPPAPCGQNATVEQLQAENNRLRKQLRQAEMEREILKKATAYFARQNP